MDNALTTSRQRHEVQTFRIVENKHRPGVIAKISRELSKRDIGISSVILHEFAKVQPYSIVTFMSRETTEKRMRAAIKAINTLDVIQTNTSMIRVELVD